MKHPAVKLFLMIFILVLVVSCKAPFSDQTYSADSTQFGILDELMDGGKRLKREVTARTGYSWEKWLIKDNEGNFHVVIIENGIIEAIDPIGKKEEFSKYKPFGGWRKR